MFLLDQTNQRVALSLPLSIRSRARTPHLRLKVGDVGWHINSLWSLLTVFTRSRAKDMKIYEISILVNINLPSACAPQNADVIR
jgi:hypothetical protein